MAAPKVVPMLLITIVTASIAGIIEANWCVARGDAFQGRLQIALDWVCSNGADCGPIQRNGPCFIPNTYRDHASYAFNSYYQRHNQAPPSCDFNGTAIITDTDPSTGSCRYPSSPMNVGGANDAKWKRTY